MEFRFNLAPIFTNSIIKVNSSLLPANFRGDRRSALETTAKMAEIINTMGEYSAKAQGLSKPVTTAQKLRMSDQNVYLLGDSNAGQNGAVLGLLKVGRKTLYVFDENGETQTVNAPCVLDFYIHESRQRSGLGKTLFETMLREEKFEPEKLAVDRPSDKLLGFLQKHYGLQKSIPQMNNFVIYDGFFDTSSNSNNIDQRVNNRMEITASPNTALFGPQFGSDEYKRKKQQAAAANIPTIQNSPVGRYAAPRPACSMAEIIHSNATPATGEPKSRRESESQSDIQTFEIKDDEKEVEEMKIAVENLKIDVENKGKEQDNLNDIENQEQVKTTNGHSNEEENAIDIMSDDNQKHDENNQSDILHINKPQHFLVNKMHTGLKNISYNVGMAVSPTNKMEFEREINRPLGQGHSPVHDNTDAQSTVSSVGSGDGYTDQGYFDLKFYHNKLW